MANTSVKIGDSNKILRKSHVSHSRYFYCVDEKSKGVVKLRKAFPNRFEIKSDISRSGYSINLGLGQVNTICIIPIKPTTQRKNYYLTRQIQSSNVRISLYLNNVMVNPCSGCGGFSECASKGILSNRFQYKCVFSLDRIMRNLSDRNPDSNAFNSPTGYHNSKLNTLLSSFFLTESIKKDAEEMQDNNLVALQLGLTGPEREFVLLDKDI